MRTRSCGGSLRSAFVLPLVGLFAVSPLGCESTPAPVAPLPTVGPAPAEAALPPAPEPPDVIGIFRWKSPQQTVDALSVCAGLPKDLVDAGTKPGLALALREVLKGAGDAQKIADLVVLDAPVDGAFALEQGKKQPRAMGAFSIPLRSFDGAKGALEAGGGLVEVAPGLLKIASKNRDLTCGLANGGGGAAPARLVCGGRDKDLLELAPWLARTVSAMPSASADLHGELRWIPFDARFGQELRSSVRGLPLLAQAAAQNEKTFDAALGEAAEGLATEVIAAAGDADKLTVDLAFDPHQCLTAAGAVSFRARKSWLVKELTDRPERQGPPPAIFWRAPKDSESALFDRGGDPAHSADLRRVAHGLLEGFLVKNKVAPADAKAVANLLNMPIPKDAAHVSASGHLDTLAPKLAGAKPQAVMDVVTSAYVGWHMFGTEGGGDVFAQWIKDAAAAYNRKGVQKAIAGQLKPSGVKNMPVIKVGQGPAALGKGSVAVEAKVSEIEAPDLVGSASSKDRVTITLHLLVMQDGKGAWMAFGTNKDDLVKRLVAARSGAPDGGTLASRPGLEPMKNAKLMTGGFFTIAPITKVMSTGASVYASATGGGLPFLADAEKTLNNLPHHGTTPMFFSEQVAGGATPRVEMTLNVPKGTLEDVGALVTAGLKMATSLRGGGPMMPGPSGKP